MKQLLIKILKLKKTMLKSPVPAKHQMSFMRMRKRFLSRMRRKTARKAAVREDLRKTMSHDERPFSDRGRTKSPMNPQQIPARSMNMMLAVCLFPCI